MTRRRKDATGALFDGSKSGRRVQRVYTPPVIAVDILGALWPEGIMCDPCSGPDSLVDAMIRVMPPANGCRYAIKIPRIGPDGEPVMVRNMLVYDEAPPGLPVWPERTYLNPEFDALEPWLRQFSESHEAVVLAPVRSHRKWWRRYLLGADVERAWLDPLKFVGHAQTFPAPLVLAYRGERRHVYREAIKRAGIGEVA